MLNKLIPALILFYALGGQPALAQESGFDCSIDDYKGTLFTDIYAAGVTAADMLCKQLFYHQTLKSIDVTPPPSLSLGAYARTTRDVLQQLRLSRVANINDQVDAMVNTMDSLSLNRAELPLFKARKSLSSGNHQGYFSPVSAETARFDIPGEHEVCHQLLPGKGCPVIFKELETAFNAYRQPYDSFTLSQNATLLDSLSRDWDEFLDRSKSQTSLEVFLTTWVQSDHFQQDYLVGPPEYQIIALHPQFIIENFDNDSAGQKLRAGFALEWIGVNFWRATIPFGLSLTRVYVERADRSNYGNGIMLHIDNRYAIGFADHGNGNSAYVTFDLLKLLENKTSKLEQYLP